MIPGLVLKDEGIITIRLRQTEKVGLTHLIYTLSLHLPYNPVPESAAQATWLRTIKPGQRFEWLVKRRFGRGHAKDYHWNDRTNKGAEFENEGDDTVRHTSMWWNADAINIDKECVLKIDSDCARHSIPVIREPRQSYESRRVAASENKANIRGRNHETPS